MSTKEHDEAGLDDQTHPAAMNGWIVALVGAERAIFAFVGALFFIAAFALALRATTNLWLLIVGPQATIIDVSTTFLDMMLLVLMMVELAYTVIVSMRGSELSPEPFLIVGLIAVIRRMLVITIGNVNPTPTDATASATSLGSQPIELGILTVVIVALVCSIVLIRRRH
jgi:hypothetical protein